MAAAPAGQLRLLVIRRGPAGQRHRNGPVRLAELGGHHELPASQSSWRRRRDEYDIPELRHGAFDRDLLFPHGHRTVGLTAAGDGQRPYSPWRDRGTSPTDSRPATGFGALRLAAWLQPHPVAARPRRDPPAAGRRRG